MSERKPIGKKMRFEIFKRDRFTCQYCGRAAPDVVLHVDHINPVNNGGKNEIVNLVTSCEGCNLGKGKRLLSDDRSIELQREQLAAIEHRREQLKMMLDWRIQCSDFEGEQVDAVETIIAMRFACRLTQQGRLDIAAIIKKFGIELVLDSARSACDQYKDADSAVAKIGGICFCKKRDLLTPGLGKLPYIRAILRNRCSYVNEGRLEPIVSNALELGVDLDAIVDLAKAVKSWTAFQDGVFDICCDHSEEYKSRFVFHEDGSRNYFATDGDCFDYQSSNEVAD